MFPGHQFVKANTLSRCPALFHIIWPVGIAWHLQGGVGWFQKREKQVVFEEHQKFSLEGRYNDLKIESMIGVICLE